MFSVAALELYHRGELAQTSELTEHALRKFPDDGTLWQLDGLVRRDRGDFDGARRALEMASVLIPLNSGAQCALAECYARAGQTEFARDLYRDLAKSSRCPAARFGYRLRPRERGGERVGPGGLPRISRREPTQHEAFFGIAFYMRRLGTRRAAHTRRHPSP